MSEPHVITSNPQKGVALLAMNRAHQKNLLSISMRATISEHVISCAKDASIQCIVITGGDQCFSAGADIAEFARYTSDRLKAERLEQYWDPIRQCNTPIIAAVNGHCLGGGFELALLADIIIAGSGAVFAQPEVNLGVIPGSGATQLMPRLAGKYKAMRYLLTGQHFTAADAESCGLVSEVVADDQVLTSALSIAASIAALPSTAIESIKRVVRDGAELPLEQAFQLERESQLQLIGSDDQRRLMDEFLKRRRQ